MWPILCTCANSCPKCHCCACPRLKVVITVEPLGITEQLDVPHSATLSALLERLRLWLQETEQADRYCWVAYWGDPRHRLFYSLFFDPEQTVGARLAELRLPMDVLPLRLCGIGLQAPAPQQVPLLVMRTPLSRKSVPLRREVRRLDTAISVGMALGVFDTFDVSTKPEQHAIFRSCWRQLMYGDCPSLGLGAMIGTLLVHTPQQLAQLARCLHYAATCFDQVCSRVQVMNAELERISGQRDLRAHLDLIDAPDFYQRVQQRVAPKANKSIETLTNWIGERPKKKAPKRATPKPAGKSQRTAPPAEACIQRMQLTPEAFAALRTWSRAQLDTKQQ